MTKRTCILLTLVTLVIIFGCSTIGSGISDRSPLKREPHKMVVPNCILIEPELMVDITEVSNIGWKEYMYWIDMVSGEDSDVWYDVLPDTNVWLSSGHLSLSRDYLWIKDYDEFPVVGVTQQQAMNFSKWRSDRVFEAFLIERRIINPEIHQNKDTYFTIEKYLNGLYRDYVPDTSINYYPWYNLPTKNEYITIKKYFQDSTKYTQQQICDKSINLENKDLHEFATGTPISILHYHKGTVQNIYGNVAEWCKERNYIFGGSWIDSCQWIQNNDFRIINKQTAWIGFRNVCRWVEIKRDENGDVILPR